MADKKEEQVQATAQEPIEIQVPQDVAVQVKLMEFDKAIVDAELQVATLKAQRVAFVYDVNIKSIQAKFQNPQSAQEAAPSE
jgi:hypothetical protein